MKHTSMVMSKWNPSSFMPSLDGLRALSVLLVLLGHSYVARFPNGGIGVDIFFAISGFLITGLLIAEYEKRGQFQLMKFYGRRFLRLLPAVLLMVLVTSFILSPPPLHIVSSLLYFSNWVRVSGDHMSFYGHMWSLSVEEQFYLVWGLVFLLATIICRAQGLKIRPIILGLSLLGVLVSAILNIVLHGDIDRVYNGSDTRSIGMFLGAAASVLVYRIKGTIVEKVIHALFPVALMYIGLYFLGFGLDYGSIAASLVNPMVATLVVLSAAMGPWKVFQLVFSNPAALYLGKISYGMYLWHYPIVWMAGDFYPKERILVVFIASLIVASLSWYLLEKPLTLRLKKYVKV